MPRPRQLRARIYRVVAESPIPGPPAPVVLIVDDEEPIRRILSQWVERLGYAPKTAESAEEALAVLRHEPVAVALCDVRMPGKDGIWLTAQIRLLFPTVSVVLVTGMDELDPTVTLRPGVVGYITKPFERESISGAVRSALEWQLRPESSPQTEESLLDAIDRWEPL